MQFGLPCFLACGLSTHALIEAQLSRIVLLRPDLTYSCVCATFVPVFSQGNESDQIPCGFEWKLKIERETIKVTKI